MIVPQPWTRASWMQALPRPPAAACTRTEFGQIRLREDADRDLCGDVVGDQGCGVDVVEPIGDGERMLAGTTITSEAAPPAGLVPATRVPDRDAVDSVPTAVTTPVNSCPDGNGASFWPG